LEVWAIKSLGITAQTADTMAEKFCCGHGSSLLNYSAFASRTASAFFAIIRASKGLLSTTFALSLLRPNKSADNFMH